MLTAHELVGFMSPALAAEIVEYGYAEDKELYRATLASVAQARKVRPVFLEKQPRPQRHATMIATLARPSMELAAATLVRGWLVKKQSRLLADFLDGIGVPHKDGVVEDLPETVDDAKLGATIDQVLAKHSREVVIVYLHAFYEMNGAPWANLKSLLESDPRLQLGG